jgi:stage II sporulation protein D
MKKLIIASLIFAAMAATSHAETSPASSDKVLNPIIRVCLIDNSPSIQLALKGAYRIAALDTQKVLMEGSLLESAVAGTEDGISIGGNEFKVPGVAVTVEKDSTIYVDGKRFRGDIDIVRKDNSKLMVINHIPVDDYLYGVLHFEISDRWPIAALKAQAIAARSFAVYQARQNRLQPYDLRSDIYSQVYGGSAAEKWATTKAVNLTRAKVLTYKGEILPAYYHATCAGSTEDAASLWNIDIPPLRGVRCNYCLNSPHYRWTKEMPLSDFEAMLKRSGYNIGKIVSAGVISRNKSGRVDKLQIKDGAGVSVVLTAKEFRQLVGPNDVKSTKFDVSIKYNHMILVGRGWGHGVGLCQWGMYGLARKGRTSEEILKFYYPGTQITTLDRIKEKR